MDIDSCNGNTFTALIKDCRFDDHTFKEFIKQQALMGSRCEECGALFCPPRAFCTECHSEKIVWQQLSGKGELAAFTSIFVCSPQMAALGYGRDNPYCTGVIKLDEGPRLNSLIIGVDAGKPETIKIGTPMEINYSDTKSQEDGNNGSLSPFLFTFRPLKPGSYFANMQLL